MRMMESRGDMVVFMLPKRYLMKYIQSGRVTRYLYSIREFISSFCSHGNVTLLYQLLVQDLFISMHRLATHTPLHDTGVHQINRVQLFSKLSQPRPITDWRKNLIYF